MENKRYRSRSRSIEKPKIIKELPCFIPSGILTKYNTKSTAQKYREPTDSCSPENKINLFIFSDTSPTETINLSTKNFYLLGKDKNCDININHESISRQHCVVQHRQIPKQTVSDNFETIKKLYIIDLDSANGTYLNKEKIQQRRYYEILDNDLVNFGTCKNDYLIKFE